MMIQFKRILPAALLALAVMGAPMVMADTPAPAAHHEHKGGEDHFDRHIAKMHDELKVTPQQEESWKLVVQTLRDNRTAMKELFKGKHEHENKSAVELLAAQSTFAQAHAQATKKFADVFSVFYAGLSADQKLVADKCIRHHLHHGHHRGQWQQHREHE